MEVGGGRRDRKVEGPSVAGWLTGMTHPPPPKEKKTTNYEGSTPGRGRL